MVKKIDLPKPPDELPGAVAGEADAVGFGVEAMEEVLDKPRFHTTGFLRVDQVTNNGVEH